MRGEGRAPLRSRAIPSSPTTTRGWGPPLAGAGRAPLRSRAPYLAHARRHAIHVRDRQGQYHPPVGDHRLAILVPVGMLTGDAAVQRDQRLDRVVAWVGGRRRELGLPLGDRIRPA